MTRPIPARSRLAPGAGLLLALLPAFAGCASHYYQRETLLLDAPDIDRYRVVYEPFEGCLIKRDLPAVYTVQRDQYRLKLRAVPGDSGASPAIEVEVSGAGSPSARFPGAEPAPAGSGGDGYTRYRVLADTLDQPVLTVQVYAADRQLGVERLELTRQRCSAVGFGANSATEKNEAAVGAAASPLRSWGEWGKLRLGTPDS